jgi:hypothetical protein
VAILGSEYAKYSFLSAMEKKTGTVRDDHKANADLEQTATHATYLEPAELAHLSEEHRQYLLAKHGTFELDPVPLMTDADPYNWPSWKVS